MKTTKQIYLLMEKKGRELAALAEGLDKIIVTEETLRNMFDGKETDSVNLPCEDFCQCTGLSSAWHRTVYFSSFLPDLLMINIEFIY